VKRFFRENCSGHGRIAVKQLILALLFLCATPAGAETLRIAYTSIAVVYGPLWLTKDAGIFKKYNIEPEFIYIAGGPPSLQALIAGDVAIAFTAAGATVAANLQGSDVVLLGASIDSLPFELWSLPSIKQPEQLKGTKLGVSRIGATTDFVARYLLKKWNLQPDKEVAIFQTGSGPQVFAALKGGAVQSGCCRPDLKRSMPKPRNIIASLTFPRRGWFIRSVRSPRAKRS
jgi:ABC-type nitrate/sulfonate/bicarbonate transport system substrate-binding protein